MAFPKAHRGTENRGSLGAPQSADSRQEDVRSSVPLFVQALSLDNFAHFVPGLFDEFRR
jgi:hypothetical protein